MKIPKNLFEDIHTNTHRKQMHFNFLQLYRFLQLCAIKPILTRSPLSKIFPGTSFYFNRD